MTLTDQVIHNRQAAASMLDTAITTFERKPSPGCGVAYSDIAPVHAIASITDIPYNILYRAVLEQAAYERAQALYDFMLFHRGVLEPYADALPAIARITRLTNHHFRAVTAYLNSAEPHWKGCHAAKKLAIALEDQP
jgi:hypothetical protein